jgi:hypothetical protein
VNGWARTAARARQEAASRLRVNLRVLPVFLQAYVPDPEHPLPPFSRPNVIVLAVAEYLPRAMTVRFNATV